MRWPRLSLTPSKREPVAPVKRTFNSQGPVITIDQLFRVLGSPDGPVTRQEAMSIPAVVRGRNLICSISTLPLEVVRAADNVVQDNPLLRQFDLDVPNVVHLSQTVDDLIFEGISWWLITSSDFDRFPMSVRRLAPGSVTIQMPNTPIPAPLPSGVDPRSGIIYVAGQQVDPSLLIRFDSPTDGILQVGARAIRRAVLLDRAAKMYADNPPATETFFPTDDVDPLNGDEEIQAMINGYQAARKQGSVAYIPAALRREVNSAISPADLQLVELQRQASLEIANLFGVDPYDLGVNVQSRNYANVVDQRRNRINDVLAPFMRAITDRLSMGDVTRRGYFVRFDLDDYLRSNPTERAAVQKTYFDMGVLDADEIRKDEGLPPRPQSTDVPADAPVGAPTDMPQDMPQDMPVQQSSHDGKLTFADDMPTRFIALQLQTFSVDTESRVIEGLAVPYGAVGNGARFERGALKFTDVSRIKLNLDHDSRQTVGVATDFKDTANGLHMKFRVARTAEGDRALTLAEDGVYDGLSIEIPNNSPEVQAVPDPRRKSGYLIQSAPLIGVALTPDPAFTDARLTRVKFEEGQTVPDTDPMPQAQPEAMPAAVPATFTDEQAERLFAMVQKKLEDKYPTLGANLQPVERQVVNPVRPFASTTVADPVPYRFDRGSLQPAAHDFGIDMIQALHPRFGGGRPDSAQYQRVMAFMESNFNTISTDINELNPTINLPRYIDQKEYQYPIWAAVNKGTPPNGIQPFQWPIYSAVTGFVGDHTEGTEPTPGTYLTSLTTVTPTPLSGKAKITREVWDMGGVPGISNLIWARMQRDYFENLEAAVVTVLNAASPASLGTFTIGGGTGKATLHAEMAANLGALQFVRGGFRFDTAFAQADLYTALVQGVDTTGRALIPALGPTNAQGVSSAQWATLTVNGVPFLPAWALAAAGQTTTQSSYLIDRTAVDGWATAPQQLQFTQTEVAFVYLAAWGYKAAVINDINGVREILYDPS